MTTGLWGMEVAQSAAASNAPAVWESVRQALAAQPASEPGGGLWHEVAARADVLQSRPQQAVGIVTRQLQGRKGPYHVLKNPEKRTYQLLSPKEFWIWERLDGTRTVQELVVDYFGEHGTFAFGLVLGLIASLFARHMLRQEPQAVFAIVEQALAQRTLAHKLSWPARALLTREWAIGGLNAFLQRLYRCGGWLLYTRPAQGLFLLLSLAGLVLFVLFLGDPRFTFASGDVAASAVILWLAAAVPLIVHELGHALTVCHFGREVNRGGLMLYFGMPAAFVDTSDIYMEGRGPRLAVTWAGPFSGLILGGACALAIWTWPQAGAAQLLFKVASISIVVSLLNLNPLLKLDGYWLLSDALEMPGLRERSLAFLRHKLWGKVRKRERLAREEIIFVVFGLLAVVWSIYAAYLGLAVWNGRLAGAVSELLSGQADLVTAVVDVAMLLLGLSFVALLSVQAYRWVRQAVAWVRRTRVLAGRWRAAAAIVVVAASLALLTRLLPPPFTLLYVAVSFLSYVTSVTLAMLEADAVKGSRYQSAWYLIAAGLLIHALTGLLWMLPEERWLGPVRLNAVASSLGLVPCAVALLLGDRMFLGLRGRWRFVSGLLFGLGWAGVLGSLYIPHMFWADVGHAFSELLIAGSLIHWRALPRPVVTISPPPGEGLTTHEHLLAGVAVLAQAIFGHLDLAYGRAAERVRARFHRWAQERGLAVAIAATDQDGKPTYTLAGATGLLAANLPLVDLAEVLDVALDGLLDQVAIEAGQPFARQAFAYGYDRLDWNVREILEEYVLHKTAWAAGLAARFAHDRSAVLAVLGRMPLLEGLTPKEIRHLAGRLRPAIYAPGETIVRQGQTGDRFYIVRSGRVAVLRRDALGLEEKINDLVSGDYFGEAALLTGTPRNATIRALTPVEVLGLDKRTFDRLVRDGFQGRDTMHGSLQRLGLLRNMPILAEFRDFELRAVAARLQRLTLAPGKTICRQGEAGDRFYIVEAGEVTVLHEGDGGQVQETARHGPGEHFGETSLLMDVPHIATVVTAEPTTLLALSGTDFDDLIRRSQGMRAALERTGSRRLLAQKKREGA